MREAIDILPEATLRDIVDSLVRLVEAAGAAVIFIGALIGVVKFIAALPKRNPEEFVPVRLTLGRYLALGLEFQLASDVLRTAIAPSFQELGKLAAVAAIRTALNFFLAREIHEEREQVAEKQRGLKADSVYSRAVRMSSLSALVAALVPVVVAAALAVSALTLLSTRRIATALPVLLDLLLAAGLLRLSATASWQAIASAAAIVVIRKLATLGIGAARRARAQPAAA